MCGLISRKMAISGGRHVTLAQAPRDVTLAGKKEDKRGSNNHEDRCLPSDPSLRKACMLTDFPGPAPSDLLLSPRLTLRLLPGPTRYLHPVVAQDWPRCSCPSASDDRNVVQRDYCRILVVTLPALRNSCFFLSFLSLAFPSPSPQSVIVSVLPFLHLHY